MIVLNLKTLADNIKYYHSTYKKNIMAVIKNNAYGHGLKEISHFLDEDSRINYFVVNTIKEGLYLRKLSIAKPILILGNIEKNDFDICDKYNLTISINNLKLYYELIEFNYKNKVHININTGMNRLGISPYEIYKIINSPLNIEGIYTHYIGGNNDLFNIKRQKKTFNKIISGLNYKNYIIHDVSSNSVSLLDLKYTNSIRIGLGLYGLNFITKPILSLKSPIINIIKVHKNESISYHSSFIAPKDGYILTIPFGYGDGWYKNIEIISKNMIQAGEMTMNYTMFFTEKYPNFKEIEIIGENNKITNMSLLYNLSPYEIITKLSPFIPRIINQK